MTDWRTSMLDAARRDEQDELSPADAEAMRQLVVAAAGRQAETPAASPWLRPMLVVASVAAVIAVGTAAAIKIDLSGRSASSLSDATAATVSSESNPTAQATIADAPNRQLQFLTPGGTRIIWVFNSDLNLKATSR
jgi:hypothetical protein